MKIAIESHVLNHSKRSGLMTYTEGLVFGLNNLDRQNQYSLIYYSLSRNPEDMPGPVNGRFQKTVLRVPDIQFAGRQYYLDKVVLPFYLKFNKIKIFHRTCGYSMPTVSNVFKILTVHDLRTLTMGDNYWKQNIESYRKTISGLDVCIVVSECTKNDIVDHFNVPDKKIKVIYLGADKRFKPASKEDIAKVRAQYALKGPFLFSIGSVPRKNIEGIIRSFAKSRFSKDCQMVLGCKFEIEKYKAIANSLNINDRLVFIPNISDGDVVSLYSGCQAFVFPSLYEGFGLPILEAMQCGAPVITSKTSSCPEVAGNAAILVDPTNIDEIAEAIDQIFSNNHLRQGLIQKGYEQAGRFSWDKYGQEMEKVYAQL